MTRSSRVGFKSVNILTDPVSPGKAIIRRAGLPSPNYRPGGGNRGSGGGGGVKAIIGGIIGVWLSSGGTAHAAEPEPWELIDEIPTDDGNGNCLRICVYTKTTLEIYKPEFGFGEGFEGEGPWEVFHYYEEIVPDKGANYTCDSAKGGYKVEAIYRHATPTL